MWHVFSQRMLWHLWHKSPLWHLWHRWHVCDIYDLFLTWKYHMWQLWHICEHYVMYDLYDTYETNHICEVCDLYELQNIQITNRNTKRECSTSDNAQVASMMLWNWENMWPPIQTLQRILNYVPERDKTICRNEWPVAQRIEWGRPVQWQGRKVDKQRLNIT